MQRIYIFILFLLLILSGCNDSDNNTKNVSGNFTTKAELLPTQDEVSIRSDLNLINPILNKSNSEAAANRNSISEAMKKGDPKEVKSIFSKSKQSLENANDSLMSLNLKSQEVQKIRVNIINGNMIAIKIHDLMLKDQPTPENSKEIALLGKQLMALQQNAGSTLDALNKKYNVNQ